LSMLKTGLSTKNEGTRDKIAMMEAKLRQMESTNPKPAPIPIASTSSEPATTSPSTPIHPSLPIKPPPALPAHLPSRPQKTSLPSLPILPQSLPRAVTKTASQRGTRGNKLTGIKIGKSKEKQDSEGG